MNPGNEPPADLSGQVIGAAIRVHEDLGPGFLESVYEQALCIELAERGLGFRRQVQVPVIYRGQHVGEHRLDLIVAESLIVELKTVSDFEPIHFAIVRSYLKATNCCLGLLLNFAAPILQVKRVGREWQSRVG